ncbi:MAG: transglycosylase SLT domain-containing protein [Thalassovita sp.]
MLRQLFLVFGLCVAISPVLGETTPGSDPLARALSAAEKKDWDAAKTLAIKARDPLATDLVEWSRLRAGQGEPQEVLAFLSRRSDWPGLKLLRRRSEKAMSTASPQQIRSFYGGVSPQTGTGVLAYADALRHAGHSGAVEAELVLAWRTLALSEAEQAAFVAQHAKLLAPHHTARLDMLLWRGAKTGASRMLPLVNEPWQKLATARLGLRAKRRDVDTLIAAVPDALKADPGLAYERFRWRVDKGRRDDAIALLLQQSQADALGEPDRWARSRRDLARRKMRAGAAREAYQIATGHGLVEGSDYADLEWLAGFIALRFLGEAELARDHFQRFRTAVFTPISLGRAGYWLGRAQEALDETEGAIQAYAEGAQFQTSFYGLLAAERVGLPFRLPATATGVADTAPSGVFDQSSVFQTGVLLMNAGETDLAERFFRHLAETISVEDLQQLGQFLIANDQPHIAVMVGKQAARRGFTIQAPYYALHPLKDRTLPVPAELSLAIARRESEFDPGVVSGAGAQGLMQVMPGTAKLVAKSLALDHDPAKVLSDWTYNVTLGSTYLAQMATRFDGNIIMISAAYNAGPGRPEGWIKTYGDPRGSAIDMVDWIELIPFSETRNYVMRVSESLPVYRARLGQTALPIPFSAEINGSTILPLSP